MEESEFDHINSNIPPGDYKKLARLLTWIENDLPGSEEMLKNLTPAEVPVIGITGPPGAGKSTLLSALLGKIPGKRTAVLAVDPTSPFNHGSLLGDRIRMRGQFNNPDVFIRSVASRGSLGGLSDKIIEMTDVLRASGFDLIFIETVGVGQSEIEIAKLADLTIVVLVPESGDEIQSIKSGLMEIADVFVVNRSDREGSETFANTLKKMAEQNKLQTPVFKTAASKEEGVEELAGFILRHHYKSSTKRHLLLAEKAWKLIQAKRMADIDKTVLLQKISEAAQNSNFNLYRFAEDQSKRS